MSASLVENLENLCRGSGWINRGYYMAARWEGLQAGRKRVGRWNERGRAQRCDAVDWDSCLVMSLVFDFGQGLGCGLSIRHCRRHWIMGAWFVFLHFFLVPLCWYAVSERQMLLFFAGGLVGVDKHLFQRVSFITSMTLPLNYIFVLLLANVDVIPKQKQLSTV